MKCDGMMILGRKVGVSIPQRHGRNWRLEDEEQAENIALDPQRRSMIMRHMAESTKDEELTRMMDQVSNPGQVARQVYLVQKDDQQNMGPDDKPIIQGNVSNCIVLKNMFTAAIETDPNWDIDIQVRCQKEG